MKISRTASFGIGAVMALVIGSGTAYAATGGTFVLGKSNAAGKTTTLTSKKGSALALNSTLGAPPLKVNRSIKVPNLNADLLDGMDESQFALAAGTVKAYDFPGQARDVNGNGQIDSIVAIAGCPAGTRRTGGGGSDLTTSGFTVFNAPDDTNTWAVVVIVDETTTENPADVTASIVCYSPRGTPVAGYRTANAGLTPSPTLEVKIERVVAARVGR